MTIATIKQVSIIAAIVIGLGQLTVKKSVDLVGSNSDRQDRNPLTIADI